MKLAALVAAAILISGLVGFALGRAADPRSAESAIRNGQLWRLQLYLLLGGSPNASTGVGPLSHYAIGEKGNEASALVLIRAGASAGQMGFGQSLLGRAISMCRLKEVQALVAADQLAIRQLHSEASEALDCPQMAELISDLMASNNTLQRRGAR